MTAAMKPVSEFVETKKVLKFVLPYFAILGTFYTLYLTKSIFVPILLGAFIALLSSPFVRLLEKFRIPRALGAVCVLSLMAGIILILATVFTSPAQHWWEKVPTVMSNIEQSFTPTEVFEEDSKKDGKKGNSESSQSQISPREQLQNITVVNIFSSLASATPKIVTQILATIFLIYFFIMYGNVLLLKLIETQNSFSDKRKTVEIMQEIQNHIVSYIYRITLINIGLGLTVGTTFYLIGIDDAFLWGALAGVLNFAPYIGPMVCAAIFSVVSYLQFDNFTIALGIAGLYLTINMLECQLITPTVLSNSFNLNPLVVFIWLFVWGWIWGVIGVLIGVPLLVSLIIYLEHTGIAGDWHKLVEHKGQPEEA